MKKIINETSKDFSTFELFNHSFTIADICNEAMKDEIKELKEFVYENIIKVFNEHLNEFKKEYFSRIKNLNQHLLDEF